jgi:glyoxylase-like metal-dependent hydrolase (beta-lactamase superfamily II)
MIEESPFPVVFHVGDMLDGYQKILSLAESPDHVIPGHDPMVRRYFPFEGDPINDIVALHEAPQIERR